MPTIDAAPVTAAHPAQPVRVFSEPNTHTHTAVLLHHQVLVLEQRGFVCRAVLHVAKFFVLQNLKQLVTKVLL